jgi:hypothetical protein
MPRGSIATTAAPNPAELLERKNDSLANIFARVAQGNKTEAAAVFTSVLWRWPQRVWLVARRVAVFQRQCTPTADLCKPTAVPTPGGPSVTVGSNNDRSARRNQPLRRSVNAARNAFRLPNW